MKKAKQTWKEKKLSFQRWKTQTFVQQKGIQALSAKRFTNVGRDKVNKYVVNISTGKSPRFVLHHLSHFFQGKEGSG